MPIWIALVAALLSLAVISAQGGNAGLIHLEARMIAKEIADMF